MSDEKGFLTKVDHKFIEADGEYYDGPNAKNQRYERREAIAARARQAFSDFALLYDVLDEHERDRVFGLADVHDPNMSARVQDMRMDLVGTLAFLYLSLEAEIEDEVAHWRRFPTPFESILEMAISKAESERRADVGRVVVDVDFSVNVTIPDELNLSHAIDKIATGRYYELSGGEARAVVSEFSPPGGGLGGWEDLAERINDRRRELGWGTDVSEE